MEVGACMSLKGATAGVWEGRFCWISLEMSHCFKYKNGEVGPKNFMVYLLKRSCLRVSRNIFFARRCIHDSEGSHHRLLKGSLLLNLTENLAFFKYKYGEVRPKTLLFNYWNDLVIGYVEKSFLEVSAYVSLKGATTDVWEGRCCWIWLEISHFFKYKKRRSGT